MKTNGKLAVAATSFALIALLVGVESTQAQGTLVGRSQFRRVVDPSERSSYGTVELRKKANGLQIVNTRLQGYPQESLAMYFAPDPTPPFQEQNFPNYFVYDISPFSRSNPTKGNWQTRLSGLNEAPPLIPFIDDLEEAAGHGLVLGKVDDSALIIGVTNIIGNATNVVFGIPFPGQGGTNTVSSPFWAPWPVLSANPGALSYRAKALLVRPEVNPPAPNAFAVLRYRFDGATGRSVFDLRVFGMPGGQVPHVFIADNPDPNNYILVDAGTLTLNKSGKNGRFLRDTKFGDPLPQQAADVGDLSGRVIQILDLNGNPPFIYAEGVIP